MTAEKMTARKWLGRARSINIEIDALLKAKQEARDQLTRMTQNYQSDNAQSSRDPHKFDRLVEIEAMIDLKIDELIEVIKEITEAINRLPDGRQRTVLLDYYIRCKTQEEIAVEMHYSYRNAKRWLRAGIAEIEKLSLFGPRKSNIIYTGQSPEANGHDGGVSCQKNAGIAESPQR